MQQIKKTADYTLYQKKSGRYALKGRNKKWINGEEKQRILVEEKLITLPEPKAKPAESEGEAAAEA
jgi:hypothetical protein